MESFILNTFEHEIGINFITIRGMFGEKKVSITINKVEFRKIIESLKKLDEENNIK